MDHTLENLGPERFQQLCQALLVKEFPGITCLPIGQPEGGRDALLRNGRTQHGQDQQVTIYQVKFARRELTGADARRWVLDAVDGEVEKVKRLVAHGATQYFFITNVAGTAHLGGGSIDRLQSELGSRLPVPVTCWWRDDINRRLDGAWDIKLRYPEVLSGQDFLRLLLQVSAGEGHARRERALNLFLAAQFEEDEEVKFKQVELHNKLLDLFVDLPFRISVRLPADRTPAVVSPLFSVHSAEAQGVGVLLPRQAATQLTTATLLLIDFETGLLDQIVVEGAPGQGKSTLVQYLCQVHRMRWLRKNSDLSRLPDAHRNAPIRVPFKVDLRDLSSWISGIDPFSEPEQPDRVTEPRTLEAFLARLIRHHSGGIAFDVNDLHEVAHIAPLFIALDGLDEIADIKFRADVVAGVTKAISRLRENCPNLRVVITSRPAAFANSPGFNIEQFPHLSLGSVTRQQVQQYAQRWMQVRNLSAKERSEFSAVLNEKMEQPHLRDLARNPMQLAILLSLIHTRGTALPDKRTSLYDAYVDLFFSREAAKSALVRKNIDLLKDIHRYLGWDLHAAAETSKRGSGGRISAGELQKLLMGYLQREQHPTDVLGEVFGAMLERVVMIVSRIQGTYEFEVQPLREYFAARHLYDTASYSPSGAEKGGTKPDRFDAIARNFYWLNVTRFFCGCFTKGELLDLAERVKELTLDRTLGKTRHPFVLAAMLLADWVFSQTPKAITEITNVLSAREALRRLLPASANPRADHVVQVPEACGGAGIASKAFEFLVDPDTRADLQAHLAGWICANVSEAYRDNWWVNSKPSGTEALANWLRAGLYLGALGRLPCPSVRSALGEQMADRLPMLILATAGRFDCLVTDEESTASLVDSLLSVPCRVAGERVGEPPLFLLPALLAIGSVGDVRYTGAYMIDPVPRFESNVRPLGSSEPDFGTSLERQAFDISRSFLDAIQPAGFPIVSEPLENAVEKCTRYWGERPAVIAMGLAVCEVPAGKNRKRLKPVGLFERDKPLCDRLRTARLRARNAGWWQQQARLCSTTIDSFLFHSALWRWAPAGMLFEWADDLGGMLDGLSDSEWRSLAEVVYAGVTLGPRQIATARAQAPLPRTLPSRRLALLMGMRDQGRYARAIFLDHLSDSGDGSNLMATFRQEQAFDAALAGKLDWRSSLSIIRATYAEGAAYPLAVRASASRVPETVAQQILGNARDYPLSLWSAAESVADANARRAVQPVGKVAKQDRWFTA